MNDYDNDDDMISCSANFSWGSWIAAGVGAVVFVAAAPVVVPALGFTSAGIAAGSTGAWMMSLSAGAVAKGSTVAVLQSIGAAGMGSVATAATGTAGAIAAKAIYHAID